MLVKKSLIHSFQITINLQDFFCAAPSILNKCKTRLKLYFDANFLEQNIAPSILRICKSLFNCFLWFPVTAEFRWWPSTIRTPRISTRIKWKHFSKYLSIRSRKRKQIYFAHSINVKKEKKRKIVHTNYTNKQKKSKRKKIYKTKKKNKRKKGRKKNVKQKENNFSRYVLKKNSLD